MGFLDKAKDLASKMTEKAGPLAEKAKPLAEKAKPLAEKAKPYADKAAPYADKAATLAAKGVSEAASRMDKATGGKYHSKIETVSGKLGDALNRNGHTERPAEPGKTEPPKPPADNPGTSSQS